MGKDMGSTVIHFISIIVLCVTCSFGFRLPVYLDSGCPRPEGLDHGATRLGLGGLYVEYVCDPGFFTLGPDRLNCSDGVTWSGGPPLCIRSGCEPLHALTSGYITFSYSGAVVNFRCEDGFFLNGVQTLVCDGSKWNGTAPQCADINEMLAQNQKTTETVSNGRNLRHHRQRLTHDEWLEQSDYTCIGRDTVVSPPSMRHATPNTKWVMVDTKARLYTVYRCKWGYELAGHAQNLYCHNSDWVGPKPKCVTAVPTSASTNLLQGDAPKTGSMSHEDLILYADYTCFNQHQKITAPDVPNAKVIARHEIHGGEPHLYVEYKCSAGYGLGEGASGRLYCKQTEWIGDVPYCLRDTMQMKQVVDPCSVDNGGCSQQCTYRDGIAVCSCKHAFILAADGRACKDINECGDNNGGCVHTCINTYGSYTCECKEGYYKSHDGHSCLGGKTQRDDHGELPPLVLFHV